MTPTLYADDVQVPDPGEWGHEEASALVRILPRRCPYCVGGTYWNDAPPGAGEPLQCELCCGEGWLRPEAPEWWREEWWTKQYGRGDISIAPNAAWVTHCDLTWRVLGIVEGDDG